MRGLKRQQQWWGQVEETPRAGLPDADKLARRSKILRYTVIAIIALMVPLLFFNLVLIANSDAEPAPPQETYAQYEDTRAVAVAAVQAWMAREPSPLPGGRFVSWDGATSKTVTEESGTGESTSYEQQQHQITLSSGTTTYRVGVLVGKSDAAGAIALSEPSLIADAPASDSFPDLGPWPDLEDINAGQSVEAAIQAWSNAYAADDPDALRLAVGDPNGDHSYPPLTGARVSNINVVAAAARWGDDQDREEEDLPERMIVNVELTLTWPEQQAETGDGEEVAGEETKVAYDLLVHQANTASPTVVAWGATGQGPDLKAYQNAVSGRTLDAPDSDSADELEGGQ